MSKFAIIITTYKRKDGQTLKKIKKAINSVKNQKHTDWKVFLTGDRYEDEEEFSEITKLLPKNKVKAVNRPIAEERDSYAEGSFRLWCSGGNASSRAGIESAIEEGFEFICYLDHDDYWHPMHLQFFDEAIEKHNDVVVLASKAHYLKENNLIPRNTSLSGYGYIPEPENVIKSSTCLRWPKLKVRARNVYKETGKEKPGDLDLWERLQEEMIKEGKKGYLVPFPTCYHIEEHAVLRGLG